ncbi:PDC sensor domain-containing protein, partial [Aliarcobacter butzleri]
MKNLNFGTKLLITLISTVIILLSSMIFITDNITYDSVEELSKQYVKSHIQKYKNEIKAELEQNIASTNSLANRLQIAINNNEKISEEGMIEFQKNLLKDNPSLFASWITFENDSYLFSKGEGLTYTPDGIFQPYVIKDNNSIKIQAVSEFSKEANHIKSAYETKKLSISKPYVDVTGVLMISISAPIFVKDKIIGIVGVDFSLTQINEEISKLKILDTGYFVLIEANGTVIAHKKKENVGKSYAETANGDLNRLKILDNMKKGEDYEFFSKAKATGKNAYLYANAKDFEIGDTKQNWVMLGVVDEDEYLNNATKIRTFNIIFGLIIMSILTIIVLLSMKTLRKNLALISNGLLSFFSFLNKEEKKAHLIELDSQDEFGQMAKVINENIKKTESLILQDNILIDDVKRVVDEV